MADLVSPKKRSEMMSGIRSKNTKPEILIRSELFRQGFRYRIHDRKLPGKPDLVLRKFQAVLFIHGCFWHRHNCHLFKWPSSRVEFWKAKINRNVQLDGMAIAKLQDIGWRTGIVWECALKGKTKLLLPEMISNIEKWLLSENKYLEIKGQ
ncbi:MAG: DNA mismatch endonuclease Vsr [Algoriphagus sp.]|jgi:DNA mismatch endonuclease (patch repair protein)|nr:DNA mismatch endonuclease Vsr [Algoriphagus sp.]